MPARTKILLAAFALPWGAPAAAADKAAGPEKTHVVVFDFHCPGDAKYGKDLANVIRMRLARHKELAVVDRFTTAESSPPLPVSTDTRKVRRLLGDQLGAQLGLYGSATRNGHDVRLELRFVDLRAKGERWRKTFRDRTERHNAVISKAVVEAVTGKAEWVPPQYGDEPEPKDFARPLNVNGTFDEGGHRGWQLPDNVASFLEKGPAGRGRVLRVRTDLARWPYINYIRAIRMGRADPANPPKIATETGYSCLGGMEGVHFKSDWIQATPGRRYWLMADFDRPGAKVFLKGFQRTAHALDGLPESALARLGMTPGQFAALPQAARKKLIAQAAKREPKLFLRECYRWYLNCRGEKGTWNHLAAPVPPRGGLPDGVEWLQIQVYCYWPAGTYRFDNVHLYKDPRQKAPLPEEKPRTPNVGKTSDVVEKQTAEPQRRRKRAERPAPRK